MPSGCPAGCARWRCSTSPKRCWERCVHGATLEAAALAAMDVVVSESAERGSDHVYRVFSMLIDSVYAFLLLVQ